MSQLLALSVESTISPSFRLHALHDDDASLDRPFGWGVAWYPAGGSAAMVVKDPTSIGTNALTNVLSDWERFASTVFIAHLRGAAKRTLIQDTHPFSRSYAGRDWVLAHNGDLRHGFRDALDLGESPVFEPVGRTDSEHLFCWLMEQMRAHGARSLAAVPRERWAEWFGALNELGTLNLILTDGVDVLSYSDCFGYRPLWTTRRTPPNPVLRYDGPEVEIELGSAADANRTAIVVSTGRLSESGWSRLEPGWAMMARRGSALWVESIVPFRGDAANLEPEEDTAWPGADRVRTDDDANAATDAVGRSASRSTGQALASERASTPVGGSRRSDSASTARTLARVARTLDAPEVASAGLSREFGEDYGQPAAAPRILETVHETVYRYEEAVTHSHHLLRLRPVVDEFQDLLEYELTFSPALARSRPFTDVFGNATVELRIRESYDAWRVRARSVVRLHAGARPQLRSLVERHRMPLVWMPWQRQMVLPYLLPPELPEAQLRELSEYALSFAERQDNDLVETLKDINRTIYEDYAYKPDSTHLETTPFDVYVNRQGVCQDFANLFIALARLLDVPARYRVGYIFTGGKYDNERQGDASHAWVEVYIPLVGWRGFDPTNGCLVADDHVRVACGRNFRDATPTSGTIYAGGQGETLSVQVKMVDRSGDAGR